MREIKFKAKRIDNGEWVYGSINTDNKTVYEILCDEGGDYEVIPETVCQFTGLKDKNGNDIYECDIFKFETEDIMSTIFSINEACYFVGNLILSTVNSHREVIGNIHD